MVAAYSGLRANWWPLGVEHKPAVGSTISWALSVAS